MPGWAAGAGSSTSICVSCTISCECGGINGAAGALIIAPAASAVGFVAVGTLTMGVGAAGAAAGAVVMFATLGVLIIAAVVAGLATWVAKAAGLAL